LALEEEAVQTAARNNNNEVLEKEQKEQRVLERDKNIVTRVSTSMTAPPSHAQEPDLVEPPGSAILDEQAQPSGSEGPKVFFFVSKKRSNLILSKC
jgi:hypothetical protein